MENRQGEIALVSRALRSPVKGLDKPKGEFAKSPKEKMMSLNQMAPNPRHPLNGRGVRRISGKPDIRQQQPDMRQQKRQQRRQKRQKQRMRVATANVGSMVGRSREVVAMLGRRKVDVCAVQETKYRKEGTRIYGSDNERYKFWWSGGSEARNDVGIMVKEEWKENVIEVVRWCDRIMKIKMVVGGKMMHIFSVYAPQQGRPEEEKEEFREKLAEKISEIREGDSVIVAGDMNAHIGRDRRGYEDVMGGNGMGQKNPEGEQMLQLCQQHGLRVCNTIFKKRKEHLITYKSGDARTQVDFIMTKGRNVEVFDCKVIPGEECLTQHRLLCADMWVKELKKPKRRKGEKRIKVWRLKDPEKKREFHEKLSHRIRETEGDWTRYREIVMEIAEEVCGKTTGRRQRERETWWWCEEVRQAIMEKREAFKRWQADRTVEKKEEYKEKTRQAKRAVAVAKEAAWQEWCREINSAEGRQRMFKIAKQMREERKDVAGGIYIKDENENILVEGQDIRERWRKYFEELLNEENPYQVDEEEKVEGPVEDISEEEIKRALKKMKKGKAPGPSGMTSDILKEVGEIGTEELAKVFRNIQEREEMPEEWADSFTVPIYKGKGDALSCGKYRGVRLLEHGMKLWEKILEERLRRIVNIDECQFGFQEGKSTTDAIFIVRQIQEKYAEKKKELYHVFVDLEKAFDRVPRELIRWALRRQMVPERLINMIMALYQNTRSRVKTSAGTSGEFGIRVGAHQGSGLSPLLFVTVMEEATRGERRSLWELLYADDLVITAETRAEAINRFNNWKRAVEERGMKVNMEKTKVMVTGRQPNRRQEEGRYPCGCCGKNVGVNSILCTECGKWCHKRCSGLRNVNAAGENYKCPRCVRGNREQRQEEQTMEVDGGNLEIVDQFCYLGEMMACEGGAGEAARIRIAAAWNKWREISSLLVNKTIPLRNRAGIYCACVRPVMLYGAETWATTKVIEKKISSSDQRMLRHMAHVKWEDRVPSEEVRRRCGVKNIVDIMRRSRLRWYGHVKRREEDHVLRRALEMEVEGARPRGRPKKTWKRCVEEDMRQINIREENVNNRREWQRLIDRPTP